MRGVDRSDRQNLFLTVHVSKERQHQFTVTARNLKGDRRGMFFFYTGSG